MPTKWAPPSTRSYVQREAAPVYGLGVTQATSSLTSTIWEYEGETFGYRVMHLYSPSSGMIIRSRSITATAAGNDDLGTDLAGSVYQTLEKEGAVHAS